MTAQDRKPLVPATAADSLVPIDPRRLRSAPRPIAGARPLLKWLPLDALAVDDAYQRRIGARGAARIAKIAEAFDWDRFGALTVTPAGDGRYAVIDGQHRAVAAASRGDLDEVPCVVVAADAPARQAEAFVATNRDRTAITRQAIFHAEVAAGDAEALRIKALLDEVGVTVQREGSGPLPPMHTRAVASLKRLMARHGEGPLEDALDMIAQSAPDEPNMFIQQIIEPVTLACARVREAEGDLDRLAAAIERLDLEDLRERASGMARNFGGRPSHYAAKAIMQAYNKNLRQKIAEDFA